MAYPITRTGPLTVPFAYQLGAAESFEVESLSAVWDGTSAGGSFIPCVSVYSQDGALLGRFKGDATVSAGDASTEATFAPFLKGITAAAASSGAQWFYATHTANVTAGGLSTVVIPWTATQTSDSSVFSLTSNLGANTTITVSKPGMTLMSVAAAQVGAVNFPGALFCNSVGDRAFGSYGNNSLTDFTAILLGTGNGDVPRDYRLSVGTVSPFDLFAEFENQDGSSRSLNNVVAGVFWWPNSTLIV